MGEESNDIHDFGVAEAKPKLKKPPMYQVLLMNDDYTPMDFVVEVLTYFFSMNTEQATQVMLQVHNDGHGLCGIFPHDVAATKVAQVGAFARTHQHPLLCISKKLDDDD